MLDEDLAKLYGVATMRLNERVRRNLKRFPPDFMFSLTDQEFRHLISQIAISSARNWGGRRQLPLAFTEQGIAMLSSVLNSDQAIEVNIAIMRAFIRKYDGNFRVVFDALRKLMSPEPVPLRQVIGLGKPRS